MQTLANEMKLKLDSKSPEQLAQVMSATRVDVANAIKALVEVDSKLAGVLFVQRQLDKAQFEKSKEALFGVCAAITNKVEVVEAYIDFEESDDKIN